MQNLKKKTYDGANFIAFLEESIKKNWDLDALTTNVMLGYYKNPEATAQVLDKDG